MKVRALTVLVAAVSVAAVVGAVGVRSASAYVYTPPGPGGLGSPLGTLDGQTLIRYLLGHPDFVPATPAGISPVTGEAYTGVDVAAGVADITIGTVLATGVGPGIVLCAVFDPCSTVVELAADKFWKVVSGSEGAAAPSGVSSVTEQCYGPNTGETSTTGFPALGGASGAIGCEYFATDASLGTTFGPSFCSPWVSGCNGTQATALALAGVGPRVAVAPGYGSQVCGSPDADCFAAISLGATPNDLVSTASTSAAFAAAAHRPDYEPGTGAIPADPTGAEVDAAVQYIVDSGPTDEQVTAAAAAIGSEVCAADPADEGCGGSGGIQANPPLYGPTPQPGETPDGYASRLTSQSFLGQISEAQDPMDYPAGSPALSAAPGTITSIAVATAAAGTVTYDFYDPVTGEVVASPLPIGGIPIPNAASTAVTMTVVPQGYTAPAGQPAGSPVANGGDQPPGAPAGPGGIDFGPLQHIAGSCNFPFGVLCWIGGVVGDFNATPVTPEVDWQMPTIHTPVGDVAVGDYDVKLSAYDDYMATVRSIESYVLWIGAVWYIGSRLIGLKGGGDPSVAVDEAFSAFTD